MPATHVGMRVNRASRDEHCVPFRSGITQRDLGTSVIEHRRARRPFILGLFAERRLFALLARLCEGRVLEPSELRGYLASTLRVLGACHARGVVHGRLSPHHVLLQEGSATALLGWRVAQTAGEPTSAGAPGDGAPALPGLTHVAPEQLAGLFRGGAFPHPATDLYRAASCFVHAATGCAPNDPKRLRPLCRLCRAAQWAPKRDHSCGARSYGLERPRLLLWRRTRFCSVRRVLSVGFGRAQSTLRLYSAEFDWEGIDTAALRTEARGRPGKASTRREAGKRSSIATALRSRPRKRPSTTFARSLLPPLVSSGLRGSRLGSTRLRPCAAHLGEFREGHGTPHVAGAGAEFDSPSSVQPQPAGARSARPPSRGTWPRSWRRFPRHATGSAGGEGDPRHSSSMMAPLERV